jgi:hypothetical protein
METVMKAAYFVSGIVTLLTFSEAHAGPEGETVSGFQCEGINIPGLHLSQDDLRTGAGFPWMLDAPRDDATGIARVSGIILHCVAAGRRKRISEDDELWRQNRMA